MKIGWSTDFIIVDGEKCAADELDRLRGSSAEWVLIERDGGSWRYVFGRQELLTLPHLLALVDQRADLTAMTLTQALGLREGMASVPVVIFQFAMSPFEYWNQLAWAGALIVTLFVLFISIFARVVIARKNKYG